MYMTSDSDFLANKPRRGVVPLVEGVLASYGERKVQFPGILEDQSPE
jgi:hypothetical protein